MNEMNLSDAGDAEVPAKGPPVIRTFLKEPLVHFLFLACLLFLVQLAWGPDTREVISIDAQAQRFLIQQEEQLRLRTLSDTEKQAIIERFIEDEILVREAKARGFTDSARIRALLLQNMRFFIGSDIPAPTDDDLRAHFEENLDAFTNPASIDLNHVQFKDPATVPDDILALLDAAEHPESFGDANLRIGYILRNLDQRLLVRQFGPETARELVAIPDADRAWRGPFEAPDGSRYFLRLVQKNPPRVPEFEQVREWVQTHWLSSRTKELRDEALGDMKQNYLIEVQPIGAESDG